MTDLRHSCHFYVLCFVFSFWPRERSMLPPKHKTLSYILYLYIYARFYAWVLSAMTVFLEKPENLHKLRLSRNSINSHTLFGPHYPHIGRPAFYNSCTLCATRTFKLIPAHDTALTTTILFTAMTSTKFLVHPYYYLGIYRHYLVITIPSFHITSSLILPINYQYKLYLEHVCR